MTAAAENPSFLKQLAHAAGADNMLERQADCWAYGQDNSRLHTTPMAVVFATDTEQVAAIVRLCNQYGIAITARGRGTGTAGGAVPDSRGIVLSLERLDRIVDYDPANRVIRVQPGVLNQAVQDAVRGDGYFWPPDPTSAAFCTVGGNIAVNSAGPLAVKYGTTRDHVLGLTAVTGNGDTLHTGVYTTKGVVGYDLTRLLIGSEGTLAIVTEATLKLTPLPEARSSLQLVYADVAGASGAVSRIMALPVTPCSLEFMDAAAVALIRGQPGVELPDTAGAILMVDVDGPAAALGDATTQVLDAAAGAGLVQHRLAKDAEQAQALWVARKALSPALRRIAPNKLNEDVVVPVSRIADLVTGLEDISARFGIPIVNFGHAGNGNIHVNLLYDTQDALQAERARPCLDQVFDLVLKLGGTLSGEHGVGRVKRDYVGRELDTTSLQLMRGIKQQFDANGILNPGKALPPAIRQ